VTTNHGGDCFADVGEVQEFIDQYESAIKAAREALSLMGCTDGSN
jgi:flagellar biosynthesis chaperone FliJ